jgi:hypothetical protein
MVSLRPTLRQRPGGLHRQHGAHPPQPGPALTGASTPLGRRGLFWEIASEEVRPYPRYTRQSVPWWLSSFFCVDVKTASMIAWDMDTQSRVYRFGTPDIIDQYEALTIDDFRQEFEKTYRQSTRWYRPRASPPKTKSAGLRT